MNVVLPEKPKFLNRRNVTYMTVLIVCAVAVAIAMYQFFSEEKLGVIIGIAEDENEELNQLRQDFNYLFTNDIKISEDIDIENIEKIDKEKDIVFIEYQNEDNSINNYNINVKIPFFNINNDTARKFNSDINKNFISPAEGVKDIKDQNIIYTVNYMASVENNILMVGILSTFKEGDKVQRTIFKTYNYNIKEKREASLEDFMQIKNVNKDNVEYKIKSQIKDSQEQAEQLKELGYDIFARNVTDEMYKIENVTNFFIHEGYLYIVYAYGNSNNTSEMDIVII